MDLISVTTNFHYTYDLIIDLFKNINKFSPDDVVAAFADPSKNMKDLV